MRDKLIRWKLDDYRELEQAVNSFNRKIKRLEKRGNIPLPESYDYVELRKNIKSRVELNRVIKSLTAFSKKGSEKIVTIDSGEEITKWEYGEIKKARTRAKRRLTSEANKIIKNRGFQFGMGDARLQEIESTLESIYSLESKKGYEFERIKERIYRQGSYDFDLKRALIFRENFMESLKEASNLEGYHKLVDKLNNIKSPIKFYEYVSKSNIAMDFGIWYKEVGEGDKITYGSFATSQAMFDRMIEELG